MLLLVVSETGLVYTFTTPKLQPLVTKPEGKNLIQVSSVAPQRAGVAVANLIAGMSKRARARQRRRERGRRG